MVCKKLKWNGNGNENRMGWNMDVVIPVQLDLRSFKPSDVVVVTYPKCGTAWTNEIVWTILKNRNFDNPKASIPINARCPFIE
ncbi:hypothetical protein Avbf_12640 [Armadillidium vulgare]|nr:hypothetical protein Avbf_12640 [Armadillidium vulgare]